MRDLDRLLMNACEACKTAVNICTTDARKYRREVTGTCQSDRKKKFPAAGTTFRMS